MFDHVLVPLDGSPLAECVLPHAVSMAKAFGGRITLLRVLEQEWRPSESVSVDPLDWLMWKAEGEAYLGEWVDRLRDIGLEAGQALLEGQAAERIVEFAHHNAVDLIVVSSHGWSGLSPWNVGSVVQKIILRAHVSVLIVRAYEFTDEKLAGVCYRRIMVPLDGSARAEIALAPACAIAQFCDAQVLLTHAVRTPEMPSRYPLSDEEIALMNRVTERNREEGQRYLTQLEPRLNVRAEAHLLVSDNAAIALHEFAEQEDVDLVVLCAHGYSGKTRWPYGSVAMSFITNGTSPLLVVQDVDQGATIPTRAELAAKEQKGH